MTSFSASDTRPAKRRRSAEVLERRAPAETGGERLPSQAALYVDTLPGLDQSSRLALFAGNLPATTSDALGDDSDAHLYFLLARQRHIPKRQRLLLWFNGGPGCSSFDGAFVEIGPFRVTTNGTLQEVSGWNEYASVLFIDQPAGTGFSYVTKNDNVRELTEAADQVVTFLTNFYKVFPEYKAVDTYIAGESYAAQYIPYTAEAILQSRELTTDIKGLLIGNGWFSPREQYPAYLQYLVERKILKPGSKEYKIVDTAVDKCLKQFTKADKTNPNHQGMILVGACEEILSAVTQATKKDDLCMNLYDTELYTACGKEWPPEMNQVTKYLRRKDVAQALHASKGVLKGPWTQCSNVVGSHFWTPKSFPSVTLLPSLLEKMPILLYNGERDLMCASTGVEAMIDNLEWNGVTGFNDTEPLEWSVDSKLAGYWTAARNLTYVKVLNASHIRFMQVDTLHAAGSAARLPSRLGNETEAVLGATHPNGTTIKEVEQALKDLTSDSDTVDVNDNMGFNDGKDESTTTGSTDEQGFDKDHELMYGPRRTAVLFLLIVSVVVLLWVILKWRAHKRKQRYRKIKGKGKAIRLEERFDDQDDESYDTGMTRSKNKASREKKTKHGGKGRRRDLEDDEQVALPLHYNRDRGGQHGDNGQTIFDIGADDEDELSSKGNQQDDDDPEAFGDIGRGKDNPWV
ncbi:Cell death protease [Microbotryomycetes sp. JL221]|nr:Cell death protease [Microbotryomycetes sp. JL221]